MNLSFGARLYELTAHLRPRHRIINLTWTPHESAQNFVFELPKRWEWWPAEFILRSVLRSLAMLVRVRQGDIPQPHKGVVICYAYLGNRRIMVVLDYSDKPEQISEESLNICDLYFKLQFLRGGYGDPRIVPGGFTTAGDAYYRYLKDLRALAVRSKSRAIEARFGFRFEENLRNKALQILQKDPRIRFERQTNKLRYSTFLKEAAISKVCLDLPGNGPFCHRLVEFLGMGSCVVAPHHITALHVELVPHQHFLPIAPDLSDLADVVSLALENSPLKQRIVENSLKFFDRFLHADQVAAYWLSRMTPLLL